MTAETQEHKEERIREHLETIRGRVEQDVISTADVMMKRLEVDAATLVSLSIVAELLPEELQRQIEEIIRLHEEVWNGDMPSKAGVTPRKPPGRRLLERFSFPARSTGGLGEQSEWREQPNAF